jgi:hypothetical protein
MLGIYGVAAIRGIWDADRADEAARAYLAALEPTPTPAS